MDRPPDYKPEKPAHQSGEVPVRPRRMLPRIPVLIGIVGLGALVTTGTWFKRQQADSQLQLEAKAVVAELAGLRGQAGEYQARIANLRWNAGKLDASAELTREEPLKTWSRERATKFATLVDKIDQKESEERFERGAAEIEALCAAGRTDEARQRLGALQPPRFPAPDEFKILESAWYRKPLAAFSRQNPIYYRALQSNEPEAAKEEVAALRAELEREDINHATPQSLVMVELLSAVTPASDALVSDWTAMASATDYFDQPDGATLKQWREAKRALQLEDWQTVVARMQAIARTTVRTRQPFRAALGRAMIKNRPEQTEAAYPFFEEAARAGDAAARAWVVEQDLAKSRYGSALSWLEAMVAEGDSAAVPQLLKVYAMSPEAVPRDPSQQAALLERIVVAPDAPPLAWLLLARQYETGEGVTRAPEKALACYLEAANRQSAEALGQAARCYLRGVGTTVDLDRARDWAVRAYSAGERKESVPALFELMQQVPDRAGNAVQEMFEHEQIASPAGFRDERAEGPGVAQLRMQLAKHLDRKGAFGAAARFYAQTGAHDAAAAHRHAELTLAHPCDVCGGRGKVQTSVVCASCAGKGSTTCGSCDGRGFNLVPGAPPCGTCGGSGGMMQEGRRATCSTCAGTGKGKGSVIKQTCALCVRGQAGCRACTDGGMKVIKDCPECRGVGSRALADH